MRTVRARRINRREAEQLLSGGPAGPDRAALRHLLDMVAAPPRPEELAGRHAAVAAFVRTQRDPVPPVPARRRPVLLSLLSRAAIVKVVVGLGVLLAGGAALAGGTGNLPDRVQHGAYELLSPLGVPVPDATGRHGGGTKGGNSPSTGPTSAPGSGPVATGPAAVGLCRAWQAAQKDSRGKAMDSTALQALSRAAGGTEHIPAFCARVLGTADAVPPENSDTSPGPPSHPGPPNPKPTHSPKDKVHPSPSPDH
ncbi:MAG: hypothetical protein AUI14_04245 [Actinobacteria bacterium 13_2_20CM_2_71_6]|nr:MAG: hypothetical protein AUI14_04245 [Actinobacteria bacterium 13_2_20CM_2_71_6]